jgi:hypothetical protein
MPYAYVEKLNHVFDTDHLKVYVTFRHQMQRSEIPQATPPVYDWYPIPARWLLEADEVPVDILSSEWLDEFTLLLTSDIVDPEPTGVTLEYAGPDEKLCYNWGKQIEPWGPRESFAGYPTTPAPHNSTHENGGADEINIAGLSGSSEIMTAYLDQAVKTTSKPTFAGLELSDNITFTGGFYLYSVNGIEFKTPGGFYNKDDPTTYFSMDASNFFFYIKGDKLFNILRPLATVARKIEFNNAKIDIDFMVHGDTVDNLVYVDAGNGRVGIGTSAPADRLDVEGNILPHTDNSYHIGKNSITSPKAWKGIILKDTTNGNYYRVEVINGVLTPTQIV